MLKGFSAADLGAAGAAAAARPDRHCRCRQGEGLSFWSCPKQLSLDLPELLPPSDQITVAAACKVGPVPCQVSLKPRISRFCSIRTLPFTWQPHLLYAAIALHGFVPRLCTRYATKTNGHAAV